MNESKNIDNSLPALNDDDRVKLVLYGNYLFDDNKYQSTLMSTVWSIKKSQRFAEQLFWLVY